MISDLLESISTFTVLPVRPRNVETGTRAEIGAKNRARILGFLPLSGVIYGLAAAGLVWGLHADTSILVAWLIPVIWFFLSGAQPFSSLCRVGEALFAKSKSAAAETLARENFTGLGMSVGLILLSGEFFALIQGSAIPRARLGMVVFFVPIVSRCAAVIFGGSTWGRNPDTGLGGHRVTSYAIALFITVIAAIASIETALVLFVVALLSGTVITVVLTARAGTVPAASLGAIILFNEIVTLWIGVLYSLM